MTERRLTYPELKDRLKTAGAATPVGSFWKHERTQNDYVVRGHSFNTACEPLVHYCLPDRFDIVWTRTVAQFTDGRFTRKPSEPSLFDEPEL